MGLQESSYEVILQNDLTTGVGTTGAKLDSTGLVLPATHWVYQGTAIHHEYHIETIRLIATAVDSAIWSPPRGVWVLAGCSYTNRVVGSDGSAVTADIMACDAGEAPASGVTQLTAADSINLKATVDTPVSVALAATLEEVGPGKYFGLNVGGTLTAVVSTITCEFKRVR